MNLGIFATVCGVGGGLLGFPTWYEFIPCNGRSPQINGINDIWGIIAAIIDILLKFAFYLAFAFVIYGGIQYLTSQGAPDKTNKAKGTLISAAVGLLIVSISIAVVKFLGGLLGA